MPCKCCEAVRFHRKLDGFIHFQRIFLPHALKYALRAHPPHLSDGLEVSQADKFHQLHFIQYAAGGLRG